jgi:transposase
VGWVWKRAKLVAKDDDPHRVEHLARIRVIYEQLRLWEAIVLADELDIQWLPNIGAACMPTGTQVEVMTPGTHEKHDLAGALELASGTLHHCLGPRKTKALFRELLQRLDDTYLATHYKRVYVVVDHDKIHQAKAVGQWLATHPRVELLLLPTYGPRANPIERAFGDVHDLCTRNHTRKRLRDLVADVVEYLGVNGPWKYKLSDIYYDPAVTAAVEKMTTEQTLAAAG